MTRGISKTGAQTLSADEAPTANSGRREAHAVCNSAEGEIASRHGYAGANLRFDEGECRPAFEFEEWDGGRMCVNRQFARILEVNGLTTFLALTKLTVGDVVRAVDCRSTARIVLPCAGKD